MNAFFAVLRTELRMQLRRPALWIALILFSVLAQVETFPSEANFQRLTFLPLSAYAANRIFFLAIPYIALVAGILSADRFSLDRRLGMHALLWTSPRLTPVPYALAKMAGSYLAFALFPLVIGAEGLVTRMIYYPEGAQPAAYICAVLAMGLLPLAFALALAYALGSLVSARAAGVFLTLYILWSSMAISADPITGATQVYRFVGDLGALVFVVPSWPYRSELLASGWRTAGFEAAATAALVALVLVVASLRRKEVRQ